MPAGDRTGPYGMGPRTGRGMGYCAGFYAPGRAHPWPGRRGAGRGPGWGGGGWGWRHWVHVTGAPRWVRWGAVPSWESGGPAATPSRQQEIEMLRQEAEWLKEQLESIGRRMEELGEE